MKERFLSGVYGKRLFNYRGINQIKAVVNKLKVKPESKSAIITLTDPSKDKRHVPCICVMDFKIRNSLLTTTAFFRSQDAGKKIYADILAIGEIVKLISRNLNVKIGPLILYICSSHIYEEDIKKINNIIKSLLEYGIR
ncbi:MAG: hypothetical protein B6U88_00860 [Candidatus Aenigmarchaeota archaeon ex4484_56]|nr:MAG: hypothetical protein B6U88_00860 [Candidatus Aenigmarchaeota archaeon ex4484_56]